MTIETTITQTVQVTLSEREIDALNLMHFFTVFGGKEYDRNEAIQQIKERRGAGGTYYDMAQRLRQY